MAPRIVLILAALLLSPLAHADVAPEPDPCDGKAKGAACDYQGGPGVCVVQKCSKLDYSQGSPPQTVDYDCVKCAAAPAPAPKSSAGCTVAEGGGAHTLALLLIALGAGRARRRAATKL